MDTKLKNSRRVRGLLLVVAVLLAAIVSLCLFRVIGECAEDELRNEQEQAQTQTEQDETELYDRLTCALWYGSFVLYYEQTGFDPSTTWGDGTTVEPWEDTEEFVQWRDAFYNEFVQWREIFNNEYRYSVDYYANLVGEETGGQKGNTTRQIHLLLPGQQADEETAQSFQEAYQCYFTLNFDENGKLTIENVWSRDNYEDEIVKAMLYASDYLTDAVGISSWSEPWTEHYRPHNFQVVYAIDDSVRLLSPAAAPDMPGWWERYEAYRENGDVALYYGTLAALLLIVLLLTSKRLWHGHVTYERRHCFYFMEAAIAGVIFSLVGGVDYFVQYHFSYMEIMRSEDMDILLPRSMSQAAGILVVFAVCVAIFGIWALSIWFLRPVLALGPLGYVKEYSLVWLIGKTAWHFVQSIKNRVVGFVHSLDFSDKTVRKIGILVGLNFLVIAACSILWFPGIFLLALYSVCLFFLAKHKYGEMRRDYEVLRQAISGIADGQMELDMGQDWGVYEPLKEEIGKISNGFANAVKEEVKSERMKAELVTNVSHDLKTPLTAIMTYVELLKDEGITQEQRAEYVGILERKALRLKVLVEDLFEVSRANSNDIQLELMEVDVINLLKQVSVEHEERFAQMGLSVIWKVPEEHDTRMLDNQKTYRIFENLFVNIEKYAMPNSRVYVEASKREDGKLSITLKNMSAQELAVSGEEITERFVRGDAARTGDGSGLGLAIAKSFTEAQKGEFAVTVDGDLFKVTIVL